MIKNIKERDEVIEHYNKTKPFYIEEEFKPSDFTCHKCTECYSCTFAWDLYNTNGDCLAEK